MTVKHKYVLKQTPKMDNFNLSNALMGSEKIYRYSDLVTDERNAMDEGIAAISWNEKSCLCSNS